MGTWQDISEGNCVAAAKLLREDATARSAVSRAYYSLYAHLTGKLLDAGFSDFGTRGERHRQNPTHENLARHVRNGMTGLTKQQRQELERAVRRLRRRREDADYRPEQTVDKRSAHEAMRDLAQARKIMRGL